MARGAEAPLQWSPQQISGWLKQEFPTHQDMQISHEAIYRSLFIQTRGVLKKELTAQLRTARRMRRPKGHNAKVDRGISSISPPLRWATMTRRIGDAAGRGRRNLGRGTKKLLRQGCAP